MDAVIAYLCSTQKNNIYIKLPERFNLANKANSKEDYSIKLNKFLYGLKQSRRMWYDRLSEYLLKEEYKITLFVLVFI